MIQSTKRALLLAAIAVALVTIGRRTAGWGAGAGSTDPHAGHDHAMSDEPEIWICPMHAQIRLPDFGQCPICLMDLVRLEGGADDHPRRLAMSTASKALASITTAPVVAKNVTRPVRLVGKVDFDETAVRTISAWVAGRIDRLYVDYTGVQVHEGDHLVEIYSPDLLTAQDELLAARSRLAATAGEASEFLASSNRDAYRSAREKLLLFGLSEAQVEEIEARGSAVDRVTLNSPSEGVVIDKRLDQGAYVMTGTPIYRIADLGKLWLKLDAYEQDLAWLRHGQDVVVEVEALPGETFEGRISYIDPFIDEHMRTAKVRVNVDNSDGRLKPGMFVRAVANARLGAGGVVLDRYLAGKWVSPMHPEIVKDGPGVCDVCGMDLVRAEDLGLVSDATPGARRPLVVPASAVLVTGKRGVVYVEVPGAESPTYEGREVVLGPRAGDEYLVFEGLAEGERVVVNGAFRIDSAMQIQAKPSMMSQPGQREPASGPEATAFRASLAPLYAAYLDLQTALARDELEPAREASTRLTAALDGPSDAGLAASERQLWREERETLDGALGAAASAADIDALRVAFEDVSIAALSLVQVFGHDGDAPLSRAFCPMAFDDKGAAWLQLGDDIRNPYFGAAMFRCGVVEEAFEGLPR